MRFIGLLSILKPALLTGFILGLHCPSGAADAFELKDGDKVVFIGSTFIERERYDGHIEARLTARYDDKKIQFRNMGWSGDTVHIQERPLNFGDLQVHLEKYEPTVVIVCYGLNEAFQGKQGLGSFLKGYKEILDTIESVGVREIVLLSPNPHEKKDPPLPDPAEHNKNLELYTAAVKDLAEERGYEFVDLYHGLKSSPEWGNLTMNGIHLNSEGYRVAAEIVDTTLHPDSKWAVDLTDPAEREGYDEMRRTIIEKNQYFFYRWRAHNGEYIYGRRAKSSGDGYGQGNAGNDQFPEEMAEFERLIAQKEKTISRLASN